MSCPSRLGYLGVAVDGERNRTATGDADPGGNRRHPLQVDGTTG